VRDVTTDFADTDRVGLWSNIVRRRINIIAVRTAAIIKDARTNTDSTAIKFTELGDSVVIGDSITITDTDGTQVDSAVIRISNYYFAGDSLIFKGLGGENNDSILNTGIKSFIPGKGDSITMSGKATFANYVDAFDSLVFKHITTDPTDSNSKPSRTITIKIRDVTPGFEDSIGLWSTMTRKFFIQAVNKAPVLTDARTNIANYKYTERTDSIVIGDSFTITDVVADRNIDSAVIRIDSYFFTGDSLIIKGLGGANNDSILNTGIKAYIPGKGDSITLSGSASFDSYVLALDSLVFKSISTNPTNLNTQTYRIVSFQVRDVPTDFANTGTVGLWSNIIRRKIVIVETRTAPILSDARTNQANNAIVFTESRTGADVNVTIGDSIAITDDSNHIDSVVVRITSGTYVFGDSLFFSDTGTTDVTYNYGDSVGIITGDSITLSGKLTRDSYLVLLSTLKFKNKTTDPTSGGTRGTRVFEFRVRDNSILTPTTKDWSNIYSRTIIVAGVSRGLKLNEGKTPVNAGGGGGGGMGGGPGGGGHGGGGGGGANQTYSDIAYNESNAGVIIGDSFTIQVDDTDSKQMIDSVVIRIDSYGLATDSLFFKDYVDSTSFIVSTFVGTIGTARGMDAASEIKSGVGITLNNGNIYVIDNFTGVSGGKHRILKIPTKTGVPVVFKTSANEMNDLTSDDSYLYITQASLNNNGIRRILLTDTGDDIDAAGKELKQSTTGLTGGLTAFNNPGGPQGIILDGDFLYCCNTARHNIIRIKKSDCTTSNYAGSTTGASGAIDGPGVIARFNEPTGITSYGNKLYVTDKSNNLIRKIEDNIGTGQVTTLAGSSGGYKDANGTSAKFLGPFDIISRLSGTDSYLYVTDKMNHVIRQIRLRDSSVTTVVGTAMQMGTREGVNALLDEPQGITIANDILYFTDLGNDAVRSAQFPGAMDVTYKYGSGTGDSITFGPRLNRILTYKDCVAISSNVAYKNTTENPTNYNTQTTRAISIRVKQKLDETDEDGNIVDGDWSAKLRRTISIREIRTAPVIKDARANTDSSVLLFTESGDSIVIGETITITDPDSKKLDSAVIRISNYYFAGDSLIFKGLGGTNNDSILNTGIKSFIPGKGDSITLSGEASLDSYLLALDSLVFKHVGFNPTDTRTKLSRTISIKVRDIDVAGGDGKWSNIMTRKLKIQAVNRAPVLTDERNDKTVDAIAYKFIEDLDSIVIGDSFTITNLDPDTNLDSAVIRIDSYTFAGDSLIIKGLGGTNNDSILNTGIKVFIPGKGDSITLSGSASIDSYLLALDSLVFKHVGSNPTDFGTKTKRVISFKVRDVSLEGIDGKWSNVILRDIKIINVNTRSKITDARANTDSSVIKFTEGGDSIVIGDSITITDVDSKKVDSAVIRISNYYFAGDSLIFKGLGGTNNDSILNTGIKAFAPGKGDSITLSGKATFANYKDALDSLVFKNITVDPTDSNTKLSRTITIKIRDVVPGFEDSTGLWSEFERKISIQAVNRVPVLTNNKVPAGYTYTQNDSVVIGDSITISDVDGTELDSAIIRISGNYLTGDSLIFKGMPANRKFSTLSIFAYIPRKGDSITLSGINMAGPDSRTLAAFELAFDSLIFRHNTNNPTDNGSKITRTISLQVRDVSEEGVDGKWSTALTRTIDVIGFNTKTIITDTRNDQTDGAVRYKFTENGDSVVIGDSFTITDNDSRKLDSMVIRIDADRYVVGDSLIFKGIGGTNNDSILNTGIKAFAPGKGDSITLSGIATLANYNDALDSLVFKSISTRPWGQGGPPRKTRKFTFKIRNVHPNEIEDSVGLITTITRTITIVAINRAPTLTDNRTNKVNYIFTENSDSVVIGDSLTLTDPEKDKFDSAIIRISNNYVIGDSLIFKGIAGTNGDSILNTGLKAFAPGKGDSITISGEIVADSYLLALDSLVFKHNGANPTSGGNKKTRQITISVRNKSSEALGKKWTNIITRNITIQAVNRAPTITDNRNDQTATAVAYQFTEEGDSILIADSLTIADADTGDTNLDSAVIRLSGNYLTGDSLIFIGAITNGATIAGSLKAFSQGSDSITISGTDTYANYQTALQKLTFKNITNNPNDSNSKTTRTVQIQVRGVDANGERDPEWSAVLSRTLGITPIGRNPVLTDTRTDNSNTATAYRYTEGGATIKIGDSITIGVNGDPDTNIDSVIIRVDSYVMNSDRLTFNPALPTGIKSYYTNGNDSLTLGGSDTIANYTLALQRLQFSNAGTNPTDYNTKTLRVFSFKVRDESIEGLDGKLSNTIVRRISVVATRTAATLTDGRTDQTANAIGSTFREGGNLIKVSDSFTIADVDSTRLDSAIITISTNYVTGDSLLVDNIANSRVVAGSIKAFVPALGNKITLSGEDTLANYKLALDSIFFKHVGTNPSDNNTKATRTVTIQVRDVDPAGGAGLLTTTTRTLKIVQLSARLNNTNNVTFTEGARGALVNNAITITDDGANLDSAVVQIVNTQTDDSLVIDPTTYSSTSITLTGATNNKFIFRGTDTKGNYQNVLRAVRFINHNINPDRTQREISFSVIDPTGLTSNTLTSLTNVAVAADNVATMPSPGVINPNGTTAQAALDMVRGSSYRFVVSNDSFTVNNFGFSSTDPTSSPGVTPYTTGVTSSGTQGNAGTSPTITIKIPRYFAGSNLYYTSKTSGTDNGGGTINIINPY